MRRSTGFLWALAISLAACGGGSSATLDTSLATASMVRGTFSVADADDVVETVGRIGRVPVGGSVTANEASLTRVVLDSGPSLLLDAGASVSVPEEQRVSVAGGRVFFDVMAGDALAVDVAGASLRGSDASMSVTVTDGGASVYVVRGEVSQRTGDTRGIVHAGEELTIADGAANVAPRALWTDWTGGLVRAGPSDPSAAPGMGTLEARVPDEVGQARWPLVIRRLDVQVEIIGELAITEVQQVFFNPASETVEGLYRVRVPEGAVLERFAVDRNGELVDGYVREQAQARAAYEAQVYRGSTLDPALLEWDAPGSYRARIYPIGAGEIRRIAIRYAEWLPRAYEGGPLFYRYPMAGGAGAPHVGEFAFVADVSDAGASVIRAGLGATVESDRVELRRSDFSPRADLWMELVPSEADAQRSYRAAHLPPQRAPGSRIVVNEADERDYWYLPLRLPDSLYATTEASTGVDVVIVADVSAGTDRAHLELGRSVAEAVAAHLGPNDRVSIVSSDLAIRAVDGGATALGDVAPARVEALLDGLAETSAGGATDLGAAIAEAGALLDPARDGAVIYIGDGAPTVGELGADSLLAHLRDQPHPIRLYAVAVGADANLDLLAELTHGGGLAMRVEERDDAAVAAMDILAHLSRPVLTRVTVEVGNGIENAFPRVPVDVVHGALLEVVGRVRDRPPSDVIVRGSFHGAEFEERVRVVAQETTASADLRLRWANERLHQQLREGATREEIAELGTRYGLITPFTSYYVPSANELSQMGATGRLYLHRDLVPALPSPVETEDVLAQAVIAVALGPLSLSGCATSEQASPPEPEPTMASQVAAAPAAVTPTVEVAQAAEEGEARMAREQAREPAPPSAAAPVPPDDQRQMDALLQMAGAWNSPTSPYGSDAPAPTTTAPSDTGALGALADDEIGDSFGFGGLGLRGTGRGGGGTGEGTIGLGDLGTIGHGAGTGTGSGYGSGSGGFHGRGASVPQIRTGEADVRGSLSREVIRRVVRRHVNEVRFCYEQELANRPALAGRVTVSFAISSTGAVQTAAVSNTTLSNARVEGCMVQAVRRWTFPAPDGGGVVIVNYPFVLDCDPCDDSVAPEPVIVRSSGPSDFPSIGAHARSQCSGAASLSLADRIPLWQERLAQGDYAGSWIDTYRQAARDCELGNGRDRRAFLSAMITRAGSLSSMIDVYTYLTDASARGVLRNAIFRRVRTPDDLRQVRGAFGASDVVDWVLVEQVLAHATTPAARLRALRGLIVQQPSSFDLQLRLLEELEVQHRFPEMRRMAARMRVDPLADGGVRTAIGEMYLRQDSTEDARRTFSEIVEFAPLDELARRRLGDLYRAHGWYEDAYRQYETLATIRPDDPLVLLLLAQAAAGAHRTDEALRLEQRVMETAAPGVRDGVARIAQLWSSVRFAELRAAARDGGDEAQLGALLSRMRRSGVLRGAGDLRVSLVWEHPDADIALWSARPGEALTRPADLDSELGIEAFDVEESESGTYRIEVRRTTTDRVGTIAARLVVVWNEGRANERVETETLTFGPGVRALAWTITGTARAIAEPTPLPVVPATARTDRVTAPAH
jgi:hypothetical protein